MSELVKQEIKNSIAFVTITREDKLNALNRELIKQLKTTFEELEKVPEVRCIILTGAGEKAFVAGADIFEISKLDPLSSRNYCDFGQNLMNYIENLSKPVIAAVNGYALGGGCELVLSCHLRVASEKAKFGLPETGLGLIPGFGGTQRLPRLVGRGKALELILTGEIIDAVEAHRVGLVNKVVPHDELMNKSIELAEKILQRSKTATTNAIKSINSSVNLSLIDGLKFERALFSQCCGTDDFKEGTTAFIERRKPVFRTIT